jgi:predicted permease
VFSWTTDLRHAWRALLRTPGFLVITVGTLALAIGSVVAMFSVVYAVLFRPLPYPEPEQVVVLEGVAPGSDLPERFGLGNEFYLQYKEQSKLLSDIFVYGGGTSTLRITDRVERVPMGFATYDMFSTLGVSPLLGRLPRAEDEDRVMVASYQMWQSWLGGDSTAIGKSYFAGGAMRELIGIMPPDFQFINENTLVWVSNVIQPANLQVGNLGALIVGRMKPGATREQLASELTLLAKGLPERFGGPANYSRFIEQYRALITPASKAFTGATVTTSLKVLLWAVLVMLAIACANVTNLFMVRVEGRHRDLAVRRALGASPAQLARLQLAEGVVVALMAGVLAVLLCAVALPVFVRSAPEGISRLSSVSLDATTLVAAFVLVVVTVFACTSIPAFRASAPSFSRLREGGRTGTNRKHWGRDALVVGQTALALVLLIGSALLVRSFNSLRNVDAGYQTRDLYTFQFAPEQPHLTDGPSWGRLHLDFMDRLRALPGVTDVGVVNNIPLDEGTGRTRYLTEHMEAGAAGVLLARNFSGGDYFRAMGIRMRRGRDFTNSEAVTPNTNVIVSRSAAEQLWPGQDPIGQRLRRPGGDSSLYIVVGEVDDVKQLDWRDEGEAIVYHPLTGPTASGYGMGSPAYVVKSSRAAGLSREVREMVRQIAPEAPVYREFTMESLAHRALAPLSFTMMLLLFVAGLALMLGAVGLYGVLSHLVTQRTREIGVRMALGATAQKVQAMVVRQGARIVIVGVAVGIAVALASTRLLGSLLYGVGAVDPLMFGAMALFLFVVGLMASWIPARRASLVDPLESMRGE